ncbi:FUSC family protein [Microbispora sp. H11081]|uniref:FUSC family protein n=1 Tax=Microbispora sp. H11081 TaxID=2729107 RepID=UPI001473E6F2|nr:FUSC family protein [Microbispora sp. H11081]
MLARAPRLEDPRLALGFGLTGAACLAIPLLVGLATGHPAGGATVGLGAWLVAGRAIANPAGVRTPYLLGVVLSVGVGTSLGILLSGSPWLMVAVASALAGLGGLVPPIGVTPALTLLLTAANPLPLDPVPHTGLQLLGGLLAAVLLTLPWPWRRTRPIVAVLGETAGTLAELAEAVADPAVGQDEWDERRRTASHAIIEIRTARARRLRWERSRAAEDVAFALRRVFHEIIALRGLCATLARRAPGAAVEVGLGDLVDSLSASLRAYLAERPPARVRVVDFGDRVDRLRERGAGGERGMVVLVLLRQIAHSAGRIRAALDGTAEAAGRVCAPGLAPALDMATLAVPPPLAFDDPRVRHALRLVLGTAFASLVIVLFKPAFPHWMVIAVLVTIQPTYGETRARVWWRVGGSTVGGLVSAVILHVAPGHWPLVALIGVSAALAFGLAPTHQAYWATFMTMCVLLLLDFQVRQTEEIAESRVVLTVAGGVIAIACTRLLWPRGETDRLAGRVGRMLDSHAAVARSLAQLVRGRAGANRAEERVRKAALDADMVAAALGYIAKEPGGAAPDAVEEALEAAQRVRDHLLTLISVLRDAPIGAGPVPDVLDAVAGRLRDTAQAVRGREPYEEPAADVGLADDAVWVGAQAERRLTELENGATGPGPKTAAKEPGSGRALLRSLAVDQALRSLDADAVRLCAASAGAFATPRP